MLVIEGFLLESGFVKELFSTFQRALQQFQQKFRVLVGFVLF